MKKYIAGLITGLIIAVSFTTYAAVQLKVIPNPYPVFINNTKANVQGYNINGSTYLKLSDLKATGLDVKFAESKITITSANTAGSDQVQVNDTDKKIDGMVIYEKDSKQYVEVHDILNLLNKHSSKEIYVSMDGEYNTPPQKIGDSNLDFKTISFSIEQLSKKGFFTIKMFDYMPCTYVYMSNSDLYDPCISIEDYKKYIQPYINLTTEELWNLFNK